LGKRNSEGEETFFIKLWEGRKLDIDWNIWDQKSKPCTIFELVIYMFKYIGSKLKLTWNLLQVYVHINKFGYNINKGKVKTKEEQNF
jgi:hypothetical protein